jgi:hypothetical protein
MAFVVNDRVQETTTTTGTGTIDLNGALTGFESFVSGIGSTNSTYYAIVGGSEFEVGIGTVTDATPDTLSRTTVISSSNSDALVNFSAGTKNVFCTLPASQAGLKNTFPVTVSGSIAKGDAVALSNDATVFAPTGTDYASLSSPTLQSYTAATAVFARDVNSGFASNADGSLILQVFPAATGNDISVRAGTVSSGVVTFGTALQIATTIQNNSSMNVTFDPTSGNFVIYYFGAASTLSVRTISVSGTTCTANTAVTLAADDDIRVLPVYYDSTADKHVFMHKPTGTDYPSATVVTVSGTTVTLATTVVIVSVASTASFIYFDCHYNSTLNKGVFLFTNVSNAISLALGTISGGIISFGTALSTGLTIPVPTTNSMKNAIPFVSYDNDQSKVLMVYLASNSGTIYSYTVSGTTLTASTTYAFTSSSSENYGIFYLSAKKVLIMMGDDGTVETWYFNTTTGTYIEDTIFTSSISAISPTGSSNQCFFGSMFYLKANQRFGFYQSAFSDFFSGCPPTGNYYFQSNLRILDIPTTNLYIQGPGTNPLLIGISRAAYSNGNKTTLGNIYEGNYDHGSAVFTFNTTAYKTYGGSFTTTSTGSFTTAGTAISTSILRATNDT